MKSDLVLYCSRHDLAFCEEHKDQCLAHCRLVHNPDVKTCSVCSGLLAKTVKIQPLVPQLEVDEQDTGIEPPRKEEVNATNSNEGSIPESARYGT